MKTGINSESDREPSNALLSQVFSKIKLAAIWEMDTGGLLRRYFGHTRVPGVKCKSPPRMDSDNISKAHSCFGIYVSAYC